MKPSTRIVVADAGPLIALARLELLDRLPRIFEQILVPNTVLQECGIRGKYPEEAVIRDAVTRGWLNASADTAVASDWNLGAGETSAIALALEQKAGVLMDDQAGRRMAERLNLAVIGTAGLLVLAKRRGQITEVRPLLDALLRSGYFLGDELMAHILRLAGES